MLPRAAVPAAAPVAPPAERGGRRRCPPPGRDVELLRDKDFADYTDAERAAARRSWLALAAPRPAPPSRRTAPVHRRGAAPARPAPTCARTVRASLRHGGEPLERHWRAPSDRPRPLVLVCDVSGSMAPYARMLLQYVQACVAARRRVEAFAFGTRLTRVTRELAAATPTARSSARRGARGRLVGRHADRRRARRRSTASTAAASGAARSSWSSPTAGTAATPRCSAAEMARLRRAAPTASSGSTRSRRTPATSRSRAGCPPRCPTPTLPRRQLARLARGARRLLEEDAGWSEGSSGMATPARTHRVRTRARGGRGDAASAGAKQLAELDGGPLLEHASARWPVAGLDRVRVVLGAGADEVGDARPPRRGAVVVRGWAEGQAASLRAGWRRWPAATRCS